jgi:hypothetical protein
MGGISDNSLNDVGSLISHLESSASQMVDQEYRDILNSLLRKDVYVPAGTYLLHGLTIAGGEYSSDARAIFKYPNNNQKGVYHDLLLSRRGSDFDFLNDDNQVVSAGSETDSSNDTYSDFDTVYFNGFQSNPTGNIKKIKLHKRTKVQTFSSRQEINNSQKTPITQIDSSNIITKNSRTGDVVLDVGTAKDWYDLDLNDGNEFHIELNTSSSDTFNISLKNASSFYGFSESENGKWGFAFSSNSTVSSGPYFSHKIILYIHKADSSINELKLQRVNVDFGNSVNADMWSSDGYISLDNQFTDTSVIELNIYRTPQGWAFNGFDLNNKVHNKISSRIFGKYTATPYFWFQFYIKSSSDVIISSGSSLDNLTNTQSYSLNGDWERVTLFSTSEYFSIDANLSDIRFGYDMENNTTLSSSHKKLAEITIEGSHDFTDFENMFNGSPLLTSVDISKYNKRQNITSLKNAFYGCTNLSTLNGVSDLTRSWSSSELEGAFYNTTNASLSLDLSTWCVTNVASAPTDFATNTAGWYFNNNNHPNWGTAC